MITTKSICLHFSILVWSFFIPAYAALSIHVTRWQVSYFLPEKEKTHLYGRKRSSSDITQSQWILQHLQGMQFQWQSCAALAYFLICKENAKRTRVSFEFLSKYLRKQINTDNYKATQSNWVRYIEKYFHIDHFWGCQNHEVLPRAAAHLKKKKKEEAFPHLRILRLIIWLYAENV